MDWQSLEEHFGSCFSEEGRPAINTRLMVSLHYLKYANNLSDEEPALEKKEPKHSSSKPSTTH
ncbi:MAG: transposase [Akkermansia sp.]